MDCISDGSDQRLISRVEDTVRLCEKRSAPCFLGFLDLHEQAVVRAHASRLPTGQWCLFGGYDEAERCVLMVYPEYYCDWRDVESPIVAVAFRFRDGASLTHRDFLGTLLSLGIRRDKIGDILCGTGIAVAFVRQEIADYVCEQVDLVGGEGVTVVNGYDGELPLQRQFEDIRDTIASARLDVMVKALIHCSREKAAEWIRLGYVSVDHLPQSSVSAEIAAPCTVSIRGKGRFLIDQIGPETKKGRLFLSARKCI